MDRLKSRRTFTAIMVAGLMAIPVGCAHHGGSGDPDIGVVIGEKRDRGPVVYREGDGKGGPPDHAPAHGYRRKHSYHYYPTSRVYYEPTSRNYWYIAGDGWQVSGRLPDSIQLGEHVEIEMSSPRPYEAHEIHIEQFPPTKAKYKAKNKGKGRGQGKGNR